MADNTNNTKELIAALLPLVSGITQGALALTAVLRSDTSTSDENKVKLDAMAAALTVSQTSVHDLAAMIAADQVPGTPQ